MYFVAGSRPVCDSLQFQPCSFSTETCMAIGRNMDVIRLGDHVEAQ